MTDRFAAVHNEYVHSDGCMATDACDCHVGLIQELRQAFDQVRISAARVRSQCDRLIEAASDG